MSTPGHNVKPSPQANGTTTAVKIPRWSFKQWLPSRESILDHKALRRFKPWLTRAYLWHFSRHSVPGAVAIGLIAAMIPGPFQIISAGLLAIKCRLHLPTAIAATLISNPFTILPIYWLAYKLGALILQLPPQSLSQLERVAREDFWSLWGVLGWPFVIGMPLLTLGSAALAYVLIQRIWILRVRYRWAHRRS
jgi:uncharacterized protein